MIRLSKRTEYALLALGYLHERAGDVVRTAELANAYRIPPALLAKVMQALKRAGYVASTKGNAGGYSLSVDLDEVRLLDFLAEFDERTALVECLGDPSSCAQMGRCDIRDPIRALNELLRQQLADLTLGQLFQLDAGPVSVRALGASSS